MTVVLERPKQATRRLFEGDFVVISILRRRMEKSAGKPVERCSSDRMGSEGLNEHEETQTCKKKACNAIKLIASVKCEMDTSGRRVLFRGQRKSWGMAWGSIPD